MKGLETDLKPRFLAYEQYSTHGTTHIDDYTAVAVYTAISVKLSTCRILQKLHETIVIS